MSEWYSCSEHLPDVGDMVWVTRVHGNGDRSVSRAFLYDDGRWYSSWRELESGAIVGCRPVAAPVIAWMSIEHPRPYEGPRGMFDGGL